MLSGAVCVSAWKMVTCAARHAAGEASNANSRWGKSGWRAAGPAVTAGRRHARLKTGARGHAGRAAARKWKRSLHAYERGHVGSVEAMAGSLQGGSWHGARPTGCTTHRPSSPRTPCTPTTPAHHVGHQLRQLFARLLRPAAGLPQLKPRLHQFVPVAELRHKIGRGQG